MDVDVKKVETLEEALPADVLELIKNSENITEVFPVNNGERFSKQVLKADEIIFQPNATLTFTNGDFPFLIIYCTRWKIKDNRFPIVIELDRTIRNSDGISGAKGIEGANGIGEIDRIGQNGSQGGTGTNGTDGGTRNNPTIYLIFKELKCIDNEQNIEDSKFVLDFDGINGGNGGDGGEGGNGGNGSNGKQGAMGWLECKEGPGRGGHGGDSGIGGKGGNGGVGGNASNINIISNEIDAEVFVNITKFDLRGGFGGRAGRGGRSGKVGRAGRGGPSNGTCGRGSDGNYGNDANPENLGDGLDGADGQKGRVFKIEVKNL